MSDTSTNEQGDEALRLLDLWNRLSRTHMMAGGGCSCGVGGVVIALEDFEQDIADFLVAEAERSNRADVLDFMEQRARTIDAWSITAMLDSLADDAAPPPAGVPQFVMERLGRTLQSFEKLHGAA